MPKGVLAAFGAAWALALGAGPEARAASCCGITSAAPTVITGDDVAQLSVAVARSRVIGEQLGGGLPVFRGDDDLEQSQTFRLEGAFLLADRWQVGATVPFTRRVRETPRIDSSSSGVGDIGLSGAYEALPEWEYSAWKPRGFVFAQLTIPTGGSIQEAEFSTAQPWGLDARGRGFFTTAVGGLLTKSLGSWDAILLTELHRSYKRTFDDSSTGEKLARSPGWGGSLGVGGGYSLDALPLRLGLMLAPAYEGSVLSEGASVSSRSEPQLVWNASAQLAWMPSSQTSVSAVYTDQTLLGPVRNVALNRTIALLFQKRWER